LAGGAAGQDSHLGLSAVPDAYVSVLQTPVGQPFTLYVVLVGPNGDEPLPFSLTSVDWKVFTTCCGDSPVLVDSAAYPDNCQVVGDPQEAMTTTVIDCMAGEVVMLAELEFVWALEGATSFPVSAGALGPAMDCLGEYHILYGLAVDIVGLPDGTPAAPISWGRAKSAYR
jgi:hypothetical protein